MGASDIGRSFRGGPAGGRQGQFEVGQLAVEAVELVALPGDRVPLLDEEGREVAIDLAALDA